MISDKLPQLLLREIIGLIIIDSIAGLFRSENYVGNYKARGKQIIEIASSLQQLCDRHKIGIVCLNQVLSISISHYLLNYIKNCV